MTNADYRCIFGDACEIHPGDDQGKAIVKSELHEIPFNLKRAIDNGVRTIYRGHGAGDARNQTIDSPGSVLEQRRGAYLCSLERERALLHVERNNKLH